MEFEQLLEAFTALNIGWQALVYVAIILIGVYAARKAGLVATGNQARLANVILAAVLAGLSENPQSEGALLAVLSSVLAALAHEGLQKVGSK